MTGAAAAPDRPCLVPVHQADEDPRAHLLRLARLALLEQLEHVEADHQLLPVDAEAFASAWVLGIHTKAKQAGLSLTLATIKEIGHECIAVGGVLLRVAAAKGAGA